MVKNKWRINKNILLNPWATVIGALAGVIAGVYFKAAVPYLRPVGDIYLSLLQMCVIPIMASAIVLSIGKLVTSKETSNYLPKMLGVFILLFFCVSLLCIGIGEASKNFLSSDTFTKKAIGKIMLENNSGAEQTGAEQTGAEQTGAEAIKEIDSRYNEKPAQKENTMMEFLTGAIPKNIFTALSNGDNLKVKSSGVSRTLCKVQINVE